MSADSKSAASRRPKRTAAGRRRPSAQNSHAHGTTPTAARFLALRVLERVETLGAYANLSLHAAFHNQALSALDRGLATELVYGSLRQRGQVDFYLAQCLDQPLDKLEPLVRNALRLGAYQILHMDRIPPEVAVDETVRCIKQAGAVRAAGLINAVLRRLVREGGNVQTPTLEEDPLAHLIHALSVPEWLAARWIDEFGPEEAAALARANTLRPPQTIRTNSHTTTRDALLQELSDRFPEAKACAFAPFGIQFGQTGNPASDPAFLEGRFTIQDEASQLVIELLDPQPGETVLDACAAPGTKSTGIAERLGETGRVLALDRNPQRLRLLDRDARRLHLPNVFCHSADATGALNKVFQTKPDRILVDAPCSGLGTLSRHPDARWRVTAEDPKRLARLQLSILRNVARELEPGGTLVYSTCTMAREENEEVIAAFLADAPEFSVVPCEKLPKSLRPLVAEDGFLHTYPHRHGCDGFFAARLEKGSANTQSGSGPVPCSVSSS